MTREELRDYVDEQRSLNNIPYHVYSALIDGIDTLEQEPKTGHWVSYHMGAYYVCSNCHEQNNSKDDNYCPNCGAKMEEVEE